MGHGIFKIDTVANFKSPAKKRKKFTQLSTPNEILPYQIPGYDNMISKIIPFMLKQLGMSCHKY